MKYSTELKKKSRMQGHRKRRKLIVEEELVNTDEETLSWTDYKAIRQYQNLGDLLDELKVYGGYNGAIELYSDNSSVHTLRNGYLWLTREE